ncbi:F-box protein CPR1-like [Fagus crenata]
MANLPSEVLTEILSRVPAKPLIKFRSISKSWLSLIDSWLFIHLHLKNSIVSLILRRESELYSISLESLNVVVELAHPLMCYSNQIRVLGSANGLLCISNVAEDIAFWNPTIKKHKVLPFLPVDRPVGDTTISMCGARAYGFGYDSVHDDYKLVRISQFIGFDGEGFVSEVKVFSLRANEWRKVEEMRYVLCYARRNATLACGALHWVVSNKFEVTKGDQIVSFNLTAENFRELPLPEGLEHDKVMIDVGVLGENVCVTADYHGVRVDVWVMKEYGVKASWYKLFTVAHNVVGFGSFEYLRPLAYSKSGEEVLLEQDGKRLVWYDWKRNEVKNVKIPGMPDSFEAEICLGSLVPVEPIRKCHEKKQDKNNKKKR